MMDATQLKELGKKMNAQDNRATQLPLFVVQQKVKVYNNHDACEKERREEVDEDYLCEECKALYNKDEDLPEECDDCLPDAFYWFDWEEEFALDHGVFLTGEECDEYIKLRSYAMGKDAQSYGISAWRSSEMSGVLEYLSSLGSEDGKPVSHYRA